MRTTAVLFALVAVIGCTAATEPASTSTRSSSHAAAAVTYSDWPTYHGDALRSGRSATMPTASVTPVLQKFIPLDGAVYASPIVAHGLTIVATENDSVYAYSTSNTLVWKRRLGVPSPAAQRPCGNIDPLGITGTPVYDATAGPHGVIYVAEEVSGATHQLFALDATTGQTEWHASLDLPGVETKAMQERGALTLAGGRVWVPFGGLAGDCGGYKGRVVGLPRGSGAPISYTVPTTREAGIWTPPGPSVVGGFLYVAVGNGAAVTGDPYDHSDSILRISGTTGLLSDSFSPATWAADNASDLDLGSEGPAIVSGKWVYADGKSGTAYVLNLSHLGGIGGQVSKATVCKAFGGTAVLLNSVIVPCTDGLRLVRISSTGTMSIVWHANSSIIGSPVIGGGRIWALDSAGNLQELSSANGAVVGTVHVGTTNRFATPAISGNRVLIGTLTGLAVVTTS